MTNDTGPRMELRALLAVVLSMMVLTLYQYFFVPAPPAPEELATEQRAAELGRPDEGVPPGPQTPEDTAENAADDSLDGAPPGRVVGADSAFELTVDGDRYVATITNVGGRVSSFVLRDYVDDFGGPLDLVHPGARANDVLMLQLLAPDAADAAARANGALFEVTVDGRVSRGGRVELGADPVTVELAWEDGTGNAVRKTLVFPPLGYQLQTRIEARLAGGAEPWIQLGPGLNPIVDRGGQTWLRRGATLLTADGLEQWDADDLEGPVVLQGRYRWVALESHYFIGALLLEGDATVRLEREPLESPALPVEDPSAPAPEPVLVDMVRLQVAVPPAGLDAPLLLAPKRYQLLAAEGHELQRVVDFGWFGIIARPLLYLLIWINSFVGNYGVAIILLTVLLRIAFLPLNHKAMVSMRRTQQLQPQMAAIRNKYKGVKELEKRQKMNEEVMELYRREGVSPLGGCLPMLAQLPILFAFYRLLSVAIEIRGAPFMLWIDDLAQHDPYYVLPLLMGATMLLQQRMTPTAGVNPAQARMMKLMPILFTALFISVPSGLVLYWTTNNVLGIGQQLYVNRKFDQPAPAKTKPATGKGKKGQQGKRGKR